MNNRLVSVIIPAYNSGKFICETISSVLNQTYKNLEIIVVNDGSRDNTEDVLSSYIKENSIKYFFQQNSGPSASRNYGIKKSSGNYIAFLDADDKWLPEKIARSVDFLESGKFDWMCTSMVKIKGDGSKIIKRIASDSWVLNSGTYEIKQLKNGLFFFSEIPVHTPTILLKKNCIEKVGIFDESFLIGEDTDLWLRFEEHGLRGGYLDEPLTIYRYNENSLTKGRKVDGLREHFKVAKKHAKILGLKNDLIRTSYADFLWQIADRYYSNRNYACTLKYLLLSIWYDNRRIIKIVNKLCRK